MKKNVSFFVNLKKIRINQHILVYSISQASVLGAIEQRCQLRL